MNIIMLIHVAVGMGSLLLSITDFFNNATVKKVSSYAFVPSIVLVIVSGIGLMISSGEIARSCISGLILLTSIIFIRMASLRYSLYS